MMNRDLKNYYHGKHTETAFLGGLRIFMQSDPELKRLMKKKQQMETEFKAVVQKHNLAMEELEDQIAARRAALKQDKQSKKSDPPHDTPRGA